MPLPGICGITCCPTMSRMGKEAGVRISFVCQVRGGSEGW